MVLYVTRPPDPPVGTDWVDVVPGQYIYDVTGVTATLTTTSGDPTIAHDSSGGTPLDGTYQNPGILYGQPGLVAGDFCIATQKSGFPAVLAPPSTGWITNSDWWINFWRDRELVAGDEAGVVFIQGVWSVDFAQDWVVVGTTMTLSLVWFVGGVITGASATGAVSAGPHMYTVSVQRNPAGAIVQFYVDGAPFSGPQTASADGPDTENTETRFGFVAPFHTALYDEVAFGFDLPSDADVAALFAAASSFAAYTAAQLAFTGGPSAYYHLDEVPAPASGRQVTFEITDGTDTTVLIPTGFPEVATAGPFGYSWVPKLNSNAQTFDGTLTTVALPPLVLPAGYTLGPRTLDLAAGDQWSDIAIWWDSDRMDAQQDFNPYEYPPGAMLVYRQDVNAPGNAF